MSASTDAEALALLESKDLVAVGKAADELRARRTEADRITFIIDRNVNYTNVCVTDCDFCAFYRGRATAPRATSSRRPSSTRRSRRRSRSAAPASSCRAGTTRTSGSTTTRTSSGR
jgi:2-iminoacetate synthase ThiH